MLSIKGSNLPYCPYCDAKVSYWSSFISKNHSIYKCANCGRKSDVLVSSSVYRLFVFVQIVSIIVFVFAIFSGGQHCLFGLLAILALFILFYAFVPFKVRFLKQQTKKSQKSEVGDKRGAKYARGTHAVTNKSGGNSRNDIYSN